MLVVSDNGYRIHLYLGLDDNATCKSDDPLRVLLGNCVVLVDGGKLDDPVRSLLMLDEDTQTDDPQSRLRVEVAVEEVDTDIIAFDFEIDVVRDRSRFDSGP